MSLNEIQVGQKWRDTYYDDTSEPSKRVVEVVEAIGEGEYKIRTVIDRFGQPTANGRKTSVKASTLRNGYERIS